MVFTSKLCYTSYRGFLCRTGENMKKRKTLQNLTSKDNFRRLRHWESVRLSIGGCKEG